MSDVGDLTTYAELADLLEQLPLLIREARRAKRITLRVVAEETRVAQSTLSRLENGSDVSLGNAVLLLRWLDHKDCRRVG